MTAVSSSRLRWFIFALLLSLTAITVCITLTDDIVRWFTPQKPASDNSPITDLSSRAPNPDPAVRLTALRSAISLPPLDRSRFLTSALADPDPAVARHAWIFAGLLAPDPTAPSLPKSPTVIEIRTLPTSLTTAVLWARSQTGADRGASAAFLWFDHEDPTQPWLPAAVYAMAATQGDWWRQTLTQAARAVPSLPSDPTALTSWRAILGAQLSNYLRNILLDYLTRATSDPLAAAIVTRLADTLPPPQWSANPGHQLRQLAHFESLPPASIELIPSNDWPPLVRALAIRAATTIDDPTAWAALNIPNPAAARLAVMYLADRLDNEHLTALAFRAINDTSDNTRINAAILIGYSGLNAQLLHDRLQLETVPLVRQHLLLALLMLNQSPVDFDPTSLLTRDDIPRLTILWSLLHTGNSTALDELFNENTDLIDALNNQRFWPILQRYLPNTPPFWLYADPDLQQFQSDILRNWYLLNKQHLSFDTASKQFTNPTSNKN